jgi:hypothetical protein
VEEIDLGRAGEPEMPAAGCCRFVRREPHAAANPLFLRFSLKSGSSVMYTGHGWKGCAPSARTAARNAGQHPRAKGF